MRLVRLKICNYRSITECEDIRIERLQAYVGENNAGKSNILKAVQCFLSAGAGGAELTDFKNAADPIIIEAEFSELTEEESKKLRPYLIGGRLILRKTLSQIHDQRTDKTKIETEYHGYKAEPRDWWLSVEKIIEMHGNRPNWQRIAVENNILEHMQNDGAVNKDTYRKGLERLLAARDDIEYDEPTLGETQALGLQPNLLSALPGFYLLPAITDYSNEIDRRTTSTVFRRLMGDLSDRVIKADARYLEIETARSTLQKLFNPPTNGETNQRLASLGEVELALQQTISNMMPTVQGVKLEVEIEEAKELFSKGVNIKIHDGVLTDVLEKGHGMQRSIVFALLQMLIKNSRTTPGAKPIILAIEEPELYIHPQTQRLIFNVLKSFAQTESGDQVLYTTHSPAFIDMFNYERIAVISKVCPDAGTKVTQCEEGVLGNANERRSFKTLTSFGLKQNEVFFSREAIIVEGPEDEIAIIATARKLNLIKELPDEIGLSILVADGKGEVPKFQKILNAFGFKYGVLLELDGNPEDHPQNQPILMALNNNKIAKIPRKLEHLVGLNAHFDDQRHAKNFFSDPQNINADLETAVRTLLAHHIEGAVLAAA